MSCAHGATPVASRVSISPDAIVDAVSPIPREGPNASVATRLAKVGIQSGESDLACKRIDREPCDLSAIKVR
jgi:hypothetical protein